MTFEFPPSPMGKEQEIDLFARYRAGGRDKQTACAEIVRLCQRFVTWTVGKYTGRGVDWEDLRQEANIGLLAAINRFDPAHGTRFITYAAYWVRHSILDAIRVHARAVRLPKNIHADITAIAMFAAGFRQYQGREPTIPEIVRGIDMPYRRVWQAMVSGQSEASIDEKFPRADGETGQCAQDSLLGVLAAPEEEDEEDMHEDAKRAVKGLLGVLNAQERAVVRRRNGLSGRPAETQAVVGEALGISAERVRMIEQNALLKLQAAASRKGVDISEICV